MNGLERPLTASAHLDTFARDRLPPRAEWPELVFDLPELTYPPRLNCAEALLASSIAQYGGDRPCLRTAAEVWTYAELDATANRVARVLVEDLGVVPGNRVLLRGPNAPWLVACWFAVLKAGAVVVATMPLLREVELRAVGERARPSVALCDHRFLEDAVGPLSECAVIPYGGSSPEDLCRRATVKAATFVSVDTAADDVCLIAFTSGTTGHPKGCVHFHRDVLAVADTFSRHVVRPEPDDLFVASPPLAFTFGLGGLVIFPLHCGASTLLLERASPELLARAIAEQRATICFTSPTAYRAMLALGDNDLASLRRCVAAGEGLPKATSDAWHAATGLRIIDGIGSTEMLHIFISAADEEIRPGATGKPVPGYRACILDAQGNELPDGVVGRLAVKGPTGCRYLDDSRQTAYVQNGWNLTGDAYLRDRDGYYWFQARTDDMIISAGYNVAGPEVEDALLDHPDVLEAAVIGVPDPERGNLVAAFVVVRSGCPRDEDAARRLQEFVKARIAPYKYPRRLEFVDALPRTATGKLQRYKLRAGG